MQRLDTSTEQRRQDRTRDKERVSELEAALLAICNHHDAMTGPRAHRLGCECGGSNGGGWAQRRPKRIDGRFA